MGKKDKRIAELEQRVAVLEKRANSAYECLLTIALLLDDDSNYQTLRTYLEKQNSVGKD